MSTPVTLAFVAFALADNSAAPPIAQIQSEINKEFENGLFARTFYLDFLFRHTRE